MTDEEIEKLLEELDEQLAALPDESEKPLTGKERVHRAALRMRMEALKKVQEAREKGSLSQETRASFDYVLLTQYGERPLLYNFIKATRFPWGL